MKYFSSAKWLFGYLLLIGLVVILILELALRTVGAPLADQIAPSLEKRYESWGSAAARMLEDRPDSLAVFDAHLGWTPRPNLNNGTDVIDEYGLRSSNRAQTKHHHSNMPEIRLAVFGDSFVYGSGVLGEEAWPAQLQKFDTKYEIYNYGVPGYGPDQAYLRFLREGREFDPEITLLGVTTPSLNRILTRSAVFRSSTPGFIAKPRFILNKDAELELLPNPLAKLSDAHQFLTNPSALRSLGVHDYWYDSLVYESFLARHSAAMMAFASVWSTTYRRYVDRDRPLVGPPNRGVFNESSEGFRILEKILQEFVSTSLSRGTIPIIVMFPDGDSVKRSSDGSAGTMDVLVQRCIQLSLSCHDATFAFEGQPDDSNVEDWFVDGFHYSVEGNRIVALWMARQLADLNR